MNTAAWAPEERDEYDALMVEAVSVGISTERRVDAYEALLADARQAQRTWANDLDRDARRTGYREQIKRWLKRQRVVVDLDGRKVEKPRTVGVIRRTAGEVYDAQVLFEVMTFDELIEKREQYVRQARAYDDNVALTDRLLYLRDLVADANGSWTVNDALARLGWTLDSYLGERVA